MTPARLSEIRCPRCGVTRWILDSDHQGMGTAGPAYAERAYACRGCGVEGTGWQVLQQAPPEFLLQPHDMYPMTQAEFDRWVGVLRAHFPRHPRLSELGTTFYPRTPGA